MTKPYEVIRGDNGALVKSWTLGVPFEQDARHQLLRVASLPFIHKWVAAMPDVHAGMGATIGSVVATDGAIVPAAVGVDIGCGMMAALTSLSAADLPSDLSELRAAIERAVPHGRTANGGPNDRGAWKRPPERVRIAWQALAPRYEELTERHGRIGRGPAEKHLGTLGTGNHFTCSHGAGRRMSRSAARRAFSVEQHRLATEGIECRKDESVLDETPGAYKSIDDVMRAQSDLVEVRHTLRQVLCIKG